MTFATQPGDVLAAGADFGFRADSSSLAIVNRRAGMFHVVELVELRPTQEAPLKPSETVACFAQTMKAHGVKYLMGDIHYRESIRELLQQHDLSYAEAPGTPVEAYMRARALFREGKVRIPNNPRLIQQLREVQGRPLPGGGMSIVHPRWRTGGHGDLVDAVVYALYQLGGQVVEPEPPKAGTKAWEDAQADKRRNDARKKAGRQWWQR